MTDIRGRWAFVPIAAAFLIAAIAAASSESHQSSVRVFDRRDAPATLSAWNLVVNDGVTLSLSADVIPYDLNSDLFSDYALKLRGIYVPPGEQIVYTPMGAFEFPIGSVIVKTFYYPKAPGTDALSIAVGLQTIRPQGSTIDLAGYHLVETRVLVLQPNGTWLGLPYVWDMDQTEATLRVGGADLQLELSSDPDRRPFVYGVPSAMACQQCHSTESAGGGYILPIGPKARNLNKLYSYDAAVLENQLVHWDRLGLLAGFPGLAGTPANADWSDDSQSIEARAIAYLDINCAHCHSARGASLQSGLMLDFDALASPDTPLERLGVCKKPLAWGGPGGFYRYDIEPGQPELSLLLYRLIQTATADVMPPLGRKLTHAEAIPLIAEWIRRMPSPACAKYQTLSKPKEGDQARERPF